MRLHHLIIVIGLLLAGPSALADTGQKVSGKHLVDHDYRFRLDASGTPWKVLSANTVKNLLPDGVAGLARDDGSHCAIIVETAPSGTAEGWSQVVTGNLALENRQIETQKKERFQGHEAVRTMTTGQMNGMSMRFQHLVFLRKGHLYQLACWGLKNVVDRRGATFEDAIRGFTLTEGPIRTRAVRIEHDLAGAGWRAKDGLFQSASCGFSLTPKAPWRIAAGQELHGINPDATGGMVHPEAYIILICERAEGVNQSDFLRTLGRNVQQNLGLSPGPPKTVRIAGKRITLTQFRRRGGSAATIYHGAFFHGDQAVQVQSWYLGKGAKGPESALDEAYGAIDLLSGAEQRKIAKVIRKERRFPNTVDGDSSERNGVYRDFLRKFTWTMPKTGFWTTETGQTARQRNQNAAFFVEEVSTGLMGMTVVERLRPGTSHRAYHYSVVQAIGDGRRPEARPARSALNGYAALTSRVTVPGTPSLTYHIVTQSMKGLGWRFVFWGLPANVTAAEGILADAVNGYRILPPGFTEREFSGGAYVDHRMGYRFESPFGAMRPQEALPREIHPIGSSAVYRRGYSWAAAFALCPGNDQQTEEWFTSLLEEAVSDDLKRLRGLTKTRSRTTLAGRDAQQISWTDGTHQLAVITFAEAATFYGLVVVAEGSGLLNRAKAGLTLLD